ncbi:MAG: hypothetical protein ACYSWX_15990, partial [Planctomycetota bacterium]
TTLLPAVLGWSSPFGGGLQDYGLRWESSSAVFRWIEPWFESDGWFGPDGLVPFAGEGDGGLRDPRRLSRAVAGALFLGVAASCWLRRLEATRATAVCTVAFALLSPTLHPWYLVWSLAPAAIAPTRTALWMAATAPTLYWPLAGWAERSEWTEASWLWPVVMLPAMLLAMFDVWRPWPSLADRR